MKDRATRRGLGSALAVAVCVCAWQLLSSARFGGRGVIASPWQTLSALPALLPRLSEDLLATAARAVAGLVIGSLAGLVVGLVAARLQREAPVITGLLDVARSVPPVVLLPMLLLAAGFGELARVANAALACVWTVALSVTTAGAAPRSRRRELLDLAGASGLQALAWTEPWESLPVLVVGLRASASAAIVVTVVGEMVAGPDRGLGVTLVSAQIVFDTPSLTLAVLAAGALGYGLNVALRLLEAWVRSRAQAPPPA